MSKFAGFRMPMPYVVLAALVLLVATQRASYLTMDQLNLVTAETFSLVLVTIGQTIVILSGGVDLSVGGVIGLTTVLAATTGFGDSATSVLLWAGMLLLPGLFVGALNGFIITRLRMQPFIVTLATWSVLDGISLLVLPTPGGRIPPAWIDLGTATVGGLSIWVLALVLVIGFWVSFTHRPLGRAIKAMGSNREAAYLAGVKPEPTTIATYALSGLFAAASGLFLVTQTASGSPIIGDDFVLPSVAATVIGGTRLSGGLASVSGAVAGAFVLTVINDVVFAFGIAQAWTIVLSGLLLLLAVLLGETRGLVRLVLRAA
jgi:ribose transport system permease protein